MGSEERDELTGWACFFNQELFCNTPLINKIKDYAFFHMKHQQVLYLSEKERLILYDFLLKLIMSYGKISIYNSQAIITTMIEIFLTHCHRFYAGSSPLKLPTGLRSQTKCTDRRVKGHLLPAAD